MRKRSEMLLMLMVKDQPVDRWRWKEKRGEQREANKKNQQTNHFDRSTRKRTSRERWSDWLNFVYKGRDNCMTFSLHFCQISLAKNHFFITEKWKSLFSRHLADEARMLRQRHLYQNSHAPIIHDLQDDQIRSVAIHSLGKITVTMQFSSSARNLQRQSMRVFSHKKVQISKIVYFTESFLRLSTINNKTHRDQDWLSVFSFQIGHVNCSFSS